MKDITTCNTCGFERLQIIIPLASPITSGKFWGYPVSGENAIIPCCIVFKFSDGFISLSKLLNVVLKPINPPTLKIGVGGLTPKKGFVYLDEGQTHNFGSIRGFIIICDEYTENSDILFWYGGTKVTVLGSGAYGYSFTLEHSTSGLILKNNSANRRKYNYALLSI